MPTTYHLNASEARIIEKVRRMHPGDQRTTAIAITNFITSFMDGQHAEMANQATASAGRADAEAHQAARLSARRACAGA